MECDRRWPSSVTPDGKYLVAYSWGHPQRGGDLWKVPLDGSDPEALLATESNEIIPEVSPDGKWLLFLSNARGPYQVVVRPFDEPQRREWNASGITGSDGIWSPAGDQILYWKGLTFTLMSTPVIPGDDFEVGVTKPLRQIPYHDASGPSLAVSPDGRRVLVQKVHGAELFTEKPLTLVTGWDQELTRLVGESQ